MATVQGKRRTNKKAANKAAGTTPVDRRLLARARREEEEAATVKVPRATLKQLRERLLLTQHAVVRAPNREIPMRGYGPIAALQAYDGIQGVIEGLDDLIEGASW